MPHVAGRLWNTRTRWLGNLLPMLVYLPFLIAGAWVMFTRAEFLGVGLWLLMSGIALGWLATNFLGLPNVGFMRREIRRNLSVESPLSEDALFVGYASQGFQNTLDSVEDVGYLSLEKERLRFRGEAGEISIPRWSILAVRFKANTHSLLGLGRWIQVTATIQGRPTTYRFEPRSKNTLLGNRGVGSMFKGELEEWAKPDK